MTLTIDDVIALRANCDDYVNAFKVLEQSKLDFQRAEDNLRDPRFMKFPYIS